MSQFDCPHQIDVRRERCRLCIPDPIPFAAPTPDNSELIEALRTMNQHLDSIGGYLLHWYSRNR